MSSISEFWSTNRGVFEKKTLSQILAFTGEGKLRDRNSTSQEFRDFLCKIPSQSLSQFSENCLIDKFEDSGFALQDIINQIGVRLDFDVKHGLYRGKSNDVGHDGIWRSKDGHSLIVEVKTTDAYRINLDIIAGYRRKLVEQGIIDKINSSILIVVGRQDTGDLEAQIRGSRHAWDIRLISTDSLLNLLSLKESLNDSKTIQQINELLKPREYTRIDKLIELIFITSKDLQLEEPKEEAEEVPSEKPKRKTNDNKTVPVNFHQECLQKIEKKLGINLIKQSRISYSNDKKSIGLIISISKSHHQGQTEKYWFAFHPYQKTYLNEYEQAHIAFGCGTPENTFLIPYKEFEPLIEKFWTTENSERMYWHVVIYERDGRYQLAQTHDNNQELIDISKYKI